MPPAMQLIWKTSEPASAMHAAAMLAEGATLVDPLLSDLLDPQIEEFTQTLAHLGTTPLIAMMARLTAAGCEANRPLAEQAIAKVRGLAAVREPDVTALATWATHWKSSYQQYHRQRSKRPLEDELQLRLGPLRSQWEARGLGMMRQFAQLTEPWLVAPQAEVVVVLPAVGGHGVAHLPANLVAFEAMLTNVDDSLPEVVRLAWLVAQLQFDLPAMAEQISPGRLESLAKLATLPPLLASAEQVELTRFDTLTLTQSLQAWRIVGGEPEAASRDANQLALLLETWWQTYQTGNTGWVAAVAALEQMLAKGPANAAL